MFSKALFKQSCKANATMWGIITFAVCFMLACVMLISGNGNIGEVKDSIQDTIITKEIDSQLEKRAITYYNTATDGLMKFDSIFSDNVSDTLSYLVWCSKMPSKSDIPNTAMYAEAVKQWQSLMPKSNTQAGTNYASTVNNWLEAMPSSESFTGIEDYTAAMQTWQNNSVATKENAVTTAYAAACDELSRYIIDIAAEKGYEEDSTEAQEILGSVMYTLNPNGTFNDFYTDNNEDVPDDYDIISLITHITAGDIDTYLSSDERYDYYASRAGESAAVFLAGNITTSASVDSLVEALSDYGVTASKYESFGYTYDSVKHMAKNAIVTYQGRLEYEISLLDKEFKNSATAANTDYTNAVSNKRETLINDISASFLSTLPQEVSDALEEIGQADLYTLIVGSIFYKLAGLLLPIIYMVMTSNNLIAGQVDSGSMAYILSTSTKRSTVVFTQAVYLIGSLLAMFTLTTATGCVCLTLITEEVELTYGNLILLNIGAFLVLLALSGLCFFTSCVFDRSRRSMAIGGGLSIFALVAAMLGLFGSPVIPSVVRLNALNNFNYATIISLFDVISIIEGTNAYILKFVILAVAGIAGYIAGAIRFTKKDLPL